MSRRRIFSDEDEETEPLYGSNNMQEQDVKPWDIFKNTPRPMEQGSTVIKPWMDVAVKILKIVTYLIVFCVVLGCAVVSKGTLLFMTSQIKSKITRAYCNQDLGKNQQFKVTIPITERVLWIWLLIFAYIIPELGTLIRSVRILFFKSWKRPKTLEIASILVTESLTAVGTAILIFVILPELDVVKGAMLTNAVCFIPGVLAFFCRKPNSMDNALKMILDIICLAAQVSAFVVWPLIDGRTVLFMIPVAVILISLGWWENFVSAESSIGFLKRIGQNKKKFENSRYYIYAYVSIFKCILFFCSTIIIIYLGEGDISFLFDNFVESFQEHKIHIVEIAPIISDGITSIDYSEAVDLGKGTDINVSSFTPLMVWLINIATTYACYAFGKFACKVMIQEFSYALSINMAVPVLLSGLIAMCGEYNQDNCAYHGVVPDYLFFITPPLYFLKEFLSQQHSWIWLIWLLSQAWISIHIWSPTCEKLARTEKLFVRPMYDAFLIDQSLALNRRRDEEEGFIKEEELADKFDADIDPIQVNTDYVSRIYACGTMWHENKEEMIEFLKSVIRLDEDQCANRIVRNYMHYNLPSYYELETHIFMDDAFIRKWQEDPDPHVNEYVELLVSTVDEAASAVHQTNMRVRPPKKYPTPYGGRLVWTLPGKTKMIAHLKDKKKIRAKKRWSQVMYMYYLLGHKLIENDELSNDRKNIIAENTYILALDGDVDFQPEAVHLLVDYMKKNKSLGAACGRIHPTGSGPMVWYQMFEYAVGHWLQKATEHVIGCVLCSPGCFSLFRGKALMDDSVMNKYTTKASEARHYVQYDQGEDRWLCTLLLQRGYRVEYSAASDAFTHAPEGFNEFYNQRRRWMPSTTANILDLLTDYKHTVNINDNISMLYIFYQIVLMVGTIIGPGAIYLMLVGAFVAAFQLDQWSSFYWNIAPILIFVIVCATCKSDTQLFFAGLISAIYGLIMMAVLVGVMLQINEDGWLAPSSLFFFCVAGEMIIAAIIHPKEFNCLKYGIIYYVTVPSMYLLLVIYSVFNMNNVSWGTREVTVVEGVKPGTAPAAAVQPKKDENKVFSFFGANNKDNAGSMEFSLGGLFKCLWCTHQGNRDEFEQLVKIQESINSMQKKLDYWEQSQFNPEVVERRPTLARRTTIIEGSRARSSEPALIHFEEDEDSISIPSSDEVMENSWFYDGDLIRGEVDYLSRREEKFWKDLLDKYLLPIDDSKDKDRISKDLKDLRDKMVFAFFMLNSLFVLVIFLLTLKKDYLHINWPVEPKVNFTYSHDENEFTLSKEYLQLEPIGFVFLIFFALILVVQFIAMIIHRFATFSQILTNTKLNFHLFETKVENMTGRELLEQDPLQIAKKLLKLKGVNDEDENKAEEPPERRKTVVTFENGSTSQPQVYDLMTAFGKRVEKIKSGVKENNSAVRRETVMAIDQRRITIQRRRTTMMTTGLPPTGLDVPNHFKYGNADNNTVMLEDANQDEFDG